LFTTAAINRLEGADTPISLGGFFGPETGKYSATDQRDFEFVSGHDCAGIFANPCNPWEIRVTDIKRIVGLPVSQHQRIAVARFFTVCTQKFRK
jgi:hypothetical protein